MNNEFREGTSGRGASTSGLTCGLHYVGIVLRHTSTHSVAPTRRENDHRREPPLTDKEKLWFFGHVAAMPRETYKSLLDPFDERDVVATMLAQNHILSRNVRTKFDALNWAISLTIAAIVLFFVLGMVYALAVAGGPQG